MKTVTYNATRQLFEKAESLEHMSHDSWRCIHCRFSDQPESHNPSLYANFILRPIVSMLSDREGYIFVCEDGDVFIMFQGATKSVLEKLAAHFGDMEYNEANGKLNNRIFNVFDLSRDWYGFYNACELKYHTGMVIQEEARLRPHHPSVQAKSSWSMNLV